jgi:hypothetical protein
MSRKTVQGQVSVGDHVVLHGLDNEELNGSTAIVLQECANEYDRFICYIESGRHEKREYRVKSKNLAPIRERAKLFPHLDGANGEGSDDSDKGDEEDTKRILTPQWSGEVKVIVTLRGINTKEEFKYNGRKARLLRNEGMVDLKPTPHTSIALTLRRKNGCRPHAGTAGRQGKGGGPLSLPIHAL